MIKRPFGKTGLKTSVLGFGGFHLCEIPFGAAEELLGSYLDAGGNYIETAPSYGSGESEIKIGRSVSHRRREYILVSKSHLRDREGCMSGIEQSLSNLRTDHLDALLMHAVGTKEELDQILSDSGALRAAEEAKQQGKIRHIGISMHGQPDILLEALHRYDFEAVMATINYFDHCNFPSIIGKLLPLAVEKGCAVILMKALADGYLYRNVEAALRFALSQPVSVAVAGINSMEMLREDLAIVSKFQPMSAQEIDELMRSAPELGSYVCRQCGACRCPQGLDLQRIFSLEALYDRQMGDGNVQDAGFYALKERLKHWFGSKERAVRDYAELAVKAGACTDCGSCIPECPFGIDIPAKLRNTDYKLDRQYGKIYE